ncbi:MAG: hypothetical protein LC641_07515, partial [Spirochaeta sp.]|nr:hypothetical protein [Spirochaeta sp.]
MKKILLLATVMMLFAAVGLMADVSFSGEVHFESGMSVDDDRATDAIMDAGSIEFNVSAAPDAYTSITIEMAADVLSVFAEDEETPVSVGVASFTTDLGAWLAGE